MLEDPKRLAALVESGLLDADSDSALDRFTQVARLALKVPVILVSLVDDSRQFFSSHLGLPEPWATSRQTPLSHSFCQHVVVTGAPLVVENAPQHDLVCTNLAIRDLGVIAYAGFPIRCSDGLVLGSFCAIDGEQRRWTLDELEILSAIAVAVGAEVDLRRRANRAEAANRELEKLTEDLQKHREQDANETASFRHDLRSPLQVIGLGVHALLRHPSASDSAEVLKALEMIRRSAGHASEILGQMRETAHPVERGMLSLGRVDVAAGDTVADLKPVSGSVHLELRRLDVVSVDCSITSLRRCIENLITNAIRFARSRVEIEVIQDAGWAVLRVSDDGEGLPSSAAYQEVWKPGVRFHEQDGRSNTGLGLNITKLIIEQAGGAVRAYTSTLGGACFEFALPSA